MAAELISTSTLSATETVFLTIALAVIISLISPKTVITCSSLSEPALLYISFISAATRISACSSCPEFTAMQSNSLLSAILRAMLLPIPDEAPVMIADLISFSKSIKLLFMQLFYPLLLPSYYCAFSSSIFSNVNAFAAFSAVRHCSYFTITYCRCQKVLCCQNAHKQHTVHIILRNSRRPCSKN